MILNVMTDDPCYTWNRWMREFNVPFAYVRPNILAVTTVMREMAHTYDDGFASNVSNNFAQRQNDDFKGNMNHFILSTSE